MPNQIENRQLYDLIQAFTDYVRAQTQLTHRVNHVLDKLEPLTDLAIKQAQDELNKKEP